MTLEKESYKIWLHLKKTLEENDLIGNTFLGLMFQYLEAVREETNLYSNYESPWVSLKDKRPPLSWVESDDPNDCYESYPVLVFSKEEPGIFNVASLIQEQDESKWNYKEFQWEIYIPGEGANLYKVDFKEFDYWMPLPNCPNE